MFMSDKCNLRTRIKMTQEIRQVEEKIKAIAKELKQHKEQIEHEKKLSELRLPKAKISVKMLLD